MREVMNNCESFKYFFWWHLFYKVYVICVNYCFYPFPLTMDDTKAPLESEGLNFMGGWRLNSSPAYTRQLALVFHVFLSVCWCWNPNFSTPAGPWNWSYGASLVFLAPFVLLWNTLNVQKIAGNNKLPCIHHIDLTFNYIYIISPSFIFLNE